MQYDVGGCVICISYKVEYFDKKRSYKNSTKEVILLFYLIFPIQPSKRWTKFRFINTLTNDTDTQRFQLFDWLDIFSPSQSNFVQDLKSAFDVKSSFVIWKHFHFSGSKSVSATVFPEVGKLVGFYCRTILGCLSL